MIIMNMYKNHSRMHVRTVSYQDSLQRRNQRVLHGNIKRARKEKKGKINNSSSASLPILN